MTESLELFSIVIMGNMNPSIHHPAWYKAIDVLSTEELQAALSAPLMCSPALSQFHTTGITVNCTEGRWEIITRDPGRVDRALDFTMRTFDKLIHTPMAAYGLNYHFLQQTALSSVGNWLAETINDQILRRKGEKGDTTLLVTTTALPDRTIQETVGGIPEKPSHIRAAYNVHHNLKPSGAIFSLTPILRQAHRDDFTECYNRAKAIADALSAAQKG